MSTRTATLADLCAVAIAECFRGDGEIVANPIGPLPLVGGRLARATFEPDLMMTDGEGLLIADDAAFAWPDGPTIEASCPYRTMLEICWSGRRHVVMGAVQLDRHGNQNLAAVGADYARPKAQLIGFRGAPGNTINHATSYWVGNHSTRVFGESVDVVSGIGWDKVDPDNPAFRFVNIHRVVTNLGVFDFSGPNRQMRAVSLHPGITPDEVAENTGFEIHDLDKAEPTRLPSDEELRLLREVIDPKSVRDREIRR